MEFSQERKHRPYLSDHGTIVLYQAKDGQTTLDVQLRDETVWLTQAQMAFLFQTEQCHFPSI
jgi:hypothetical protein